MMTLSLRVLIGISIALGLLGVLPPSARAQPFALPNDDPPARKKAKAKAKSSEKQDSRADLSAAELAVDEQAEEAARTALGERAATFKTRRTKHFTIFYDTGEDEVKVFAAAIERTYRSCAKFAVKLDIAVRPPKSKLLIYYFNELESYSAHSEKLGAGKRRESEPGFYVPLLNLSYFYNFQNSATFRKKRAEAEARIQRLQEQLKQAKSKTERRRIGEEIKQARWVINRTKSLGGDQNESTVQHEVAHQVLWNIGFHNAKAMQANPRWLAEGAAQMFEPISTGQGANFGIVNADRLREFQAVRQAGKLFPLRDFVSDGGFFNRPEIAYPQSWALMHYLSRVQGEQLRKYISLVNKRPKNYRPTPGEELATFEKAFGRPDERWVSAWLKWMKDVR